MNDNMIFSENIFRELSRIFGEDILDDKIQEALSFKNNQKLAELGDSVLDLVIHEHEYKKPDSKARTMDTLRQKIGTKKNNQKILNDDKRLQQLIIKNDYNQNPPKTIGLIRSDRYMEAIIGAIFIRKSLSEARKFVRHIYEIT